MADNVKKTKDLKNVLTELNDILRNTERVQRKTFDSIEKKSKKATRSTKELTSSFETFNEVMDNISAQGLANTLKDMPNYIRGVTKLTTSYSKYTEEAGRTKEMLQTLGISFNKTMKDLEVKSNSVSKAMSQLMARSNKFASIKENLSVVPKELKKIHEAMEATPEIKVSSIEKLSDLVNGLEGKISDIDFKDLKGNLDKLGKSDAGEGLVKSIQEKLKGIKVESPIIEGEKIGKSLLNEISAELNKIGELSPGDELINSFLNNIKEIEKDNTFSKVIEAHKGDIEGFKKVLSEPGTTYEEVANKMISLNGKIKESISGFFDSFNSKASILENELNNITKQQEELSDKFRKSSEITFFTDEAIADFQGTLAQMSAEASAIKSNNIIPNEQLLKSQEMLQALRKLRDLKSENVKLNAELTSDDSARERTVGEIKDAQEKNAKAIQDQISHMRDLERLSENYTSNKRKAIENGIGEKEAKNFGGQLFQIAGTLKKTGQNLGKDSAIGRGLNKVSELTENFGGKLQKLSFPVGLITGAIAFSKILLKLEGQYASMSQEIINSGALMSTGVNSVGDAMDNLNMQAQNTKGLMNAAFGGDDLPLAREEIMGTVNALNAAGIPAKNLKEQMKGVAHTAYEAENAFVGASAMVTTFSTNMGISKEEVANAVGEMGHEFSSTMGSVKDTFTEITAAAKDSDMSTNRFLATVQTATAGMSYYESQVSDTAKIMSHLSKTTNMSGADLEKFGKAMGNMTEDTQQAMKSLSLMQSKDKGALQKLAKSVEGAMPKLEEKIAKAKERGDEKALKNLKAQKENAQDLQKALEGGNLLEAGALMHTAGADVKASVAAEQLKFIKKTAGGDYGKSRMIGKQMGLEDLVKVDKVRGGREGLDLDEIKKAMESSEETYEDQRKKTQEMMKKSGDSRNKLLGSIWGTLLTSFGSLIPAVLSIAGAVAGYGGVKGLLRMLGKGGKGGRAGGGLIGSVTKKGGDLFKGLGKGGKLGSLFKGLGKGLGKGGSLLKGLGKVGGKVLGPLGAISNLAFGAKDIYDVYSSDKTTSKEKGKTVGKVAGGAGGTLGGAAAGAALGTLIFPGVGTAIGGILGAVGGDMLGDWIGSKAGEAIGESLEGDLKTRKIKKPAHKKIDLLTRKNAIANQLGLDSNMIPNKYPELHNQMDLAKKAEPGRLNKMGEANKIVNNNNITNHNIFNINGGDPEKLKTVILDVITKHERQTS